MTILDLLNQSANRLSEAGVADPRREAASLLAFALDKAPAFLIAHPEYELTDDEAARFDGLMARRANREPFQYITEQQEFYGLDFEVTPDVLIPRPETEILVEEAIRELNKLNELNTLRELTVCEIGVGSGCITVSILQNVPAATAIATDISEKAIGVAMRNATSHRIADRLTFIEGDLFAGVTEKFDMIVSNPPYIPDADLTDMQKEVRDFEPHSALFAGADGLDIIRRIVNEAPEHLNRGGLLLIEIGFGQSKVLGDLVDPSIWSKPEFLPDLQSIDRVLKVRLR
ncbi:MAG: peptide chain release factor N(5)-glutamine methyltransferase [Pyrinomonadaceae bacterium]|nr:peptide chain release factor N(5)-glutamine methyltransferase [Chloracidobacterium sp.]MBP7415468.1 peptide chain release factor N(5)-glutamine methyltransferase [Pyrinomonadaceae bacterium]